ncbi:hypothetical protein, partial [Pilosibacter fragilis]|uniref:hypothetical protein n=1 Tax=Pilosibacter fragilis TaxID=3078042 RepID=UPI0032D46712
AANERRCIWRGAEDLTFTVFRLDSIFAGSTNNTHKKTSANFTAKYALYKYLYLIRDKLLKYLENK